MFSQQEIEQANERAEQIRRDEPHIVGARYDIRLGRVILTLSSNAWFMFTPSNAQGLETATAAQLKQIEISPSGYGIHFPQLDADLSLPSMIRGHFGTPNWMARHLGAAGGRSRSEAKKTAPRRTAN